MAGVSRLQYTAETRVVRVMCSGRVALEMVLRSFADGIDGVFIGGCRLNECNYVTQGNYHALTMVLLCKRIMEHIKLNPERLRIEFMSSAEGVVFAEEMSKFSRKVRELGPIGIGEGIDEFEMKENLAKMMSLVPYFKVTNNEKLGTRLLNPEEYDKFFTREEVDKLIIEAPAYYINPEKCQACMICARRCPADAIISVKGQIHVIKQPDCIKCGTCLEVCPPKFGAVMKIVGAPVPLPVPEEQRTVVRKGKEAEAASGQ